MVRVTEAWTYVGFWYLIRCLIFIKQLNLILVVFVDFSWTYPFFLPLSINPKVAGQHDDPLHMSQYSFLNIYCYQKLGWSMITPNKDSITLFFLGFAWVLEAFYAFGHLAAPPSFFTSSFCYPKSNRVALPPSVHPPSQEDSQLIPFPIFRKIIAFTNVWAVSYTHLDVYKRQV